MKRSSIDMDRIDMDRYSMHWAIPRAARFSTGSPKGPCPFRNWQSLSRSPSPPLRNTCKSLRRSD